VIALLLFCLGMVLFSTNQPQLLRVLEPAGRYTGTYDVIIHKQDVEAILKDPALDLKKGKIQVRIYDPCGAKVAKLALVKKGRIKWLFRTLPGDMLGVKMDGTQARKLLDEACKKNKKTGYQLVLTREERRSDTLVVVGCYPLIFSHQVDLHGVLIYPLRVAPGDAIEKKVVLTIFNEGTTSATNFYVQLLLSPDQTDPSKNIPLANSRLQVGEVPPGGSLNLLFKGPLKIPSHLPAGQYKLIAFLDCENSIKEVKENNNLLSRVMIISQEASNSLPRPGQAPVDLRKIVEKKRGKSQRRKY
jgi:hypothetical protein